MLTSDIAFTALPRLDPGLGRIEAFAPAGSTIAEIVTQALPGAVGPLLDRVRVVIEDAVIERRHWARIRPKPGARVIVRVVPGNDVLRNVLSIVVTIAAVALGQFYLGPLLAGATGLSAGVAGSIATGATLLAGNLLLNALIPPAQPKKSTAESPTYSIQGWQNQQNPDGVVPAVLGRHRLAPVYAAAPYTEASGDDRYVTAVFVLGYGPLLVEKIQIGETPIENFSDVVVEVRSGNIGDAPLTIYPQQVIEEPLAIQVENGAGPVVRYTAADATEASIDITFPQGITGINKTGKPVLWTVIMEIWQRPAGSSDPWISVASLPFTDKRQKAKTITHRWTLPSRGRWEVRVGRGTQDDPPDQSGASVQVSSRSDWTSLCSFRPEYPINFDRPLALAAVRVRATGQLNGTLDQFNVVATSICPDWNDTDWVLQPTRNPASHFRHVLTGPAISYPLSSAETYALEDWWSFCAARGIVYDRVHDYEASVLDVLSDIARAGRATPHDRGNAWGVVIDRIRTEVAAHITPRNSWGFQGERSYIDTPDGFRVSFLDETNDFVEGERIVPWPGHVGAVQVAEKLELPGFVNPGLVWKEARRRQRETEYRPDTFTVNQDFEALTVTRGDLVVLNNDVLVETHRAARVSLVSAEAVLLDELVLMEAGQSYACRFRREDGSSLLRSVVTMPGETQTLALTGSGDMPSPGDLAMFGLAGRETLECIVKGIEGADNLSARLTLIPHAPEIEALVDAEVPPPWNGRVGGEINPPTTPPLAPSILSITSGRDAAGAATTANPYPVVVLLAGATGGTVPLATFVVEHRLAGATAWLTATAPVASGRVTLSGYATGNSVELRAYAVSSRGEAGDRTGSLIHVVAATDPAPPDAVRDLAVSSSGSTATLMWTHSASPETVGAVVRRGIGSTAAFAGSVAITTVYGAPNAVGIYDDTGLAGGTYRYWVVAIDANDPPVGAAPAGPVTVAL